MEEMPTTALQDVTKMARHVTVVVISERTPPNDRMQFMTCKVELVANRII